MDNREGRTVKKLVHQAEQETTQSDDTEDKTENRKEDEL